VWHGFRDWSLECIGFSLKSDKVDAVTDVGAWIIEHVHTLTHTHLHTHSLSVSLSLSDTHTHTQALKTADGHKRYVEYRNKRAE